MMLCLVLSGLLCLALLPSTALASQWSNNNKTINGGLVPNVVIGGGNWGLGQWHDDEDVTGNTVTINNGSNASHTVASFIIGGNGGLDAKVTDNSVTINNSTLYGYNIAGGISYKYYEDRSGIVTGNSVTIKNSIVGKSYDVGITAVWGSGNVSNNSVTITGSTVLDTDVMVAFANPGPITSFSGNNITIIDSTVERDVFLARGEIDRDYLDYCSDNSITLINSSIEGSIRARFGYDNTLNLFSTNKVGHLSDFEYLNFYLPATLAANGKMLTVTGTAVITGSTVNVGIDGASSPLKTGDQVILIDAGTLEGAPVNTTANGKGMQGVTLLYVFDLTTQGNQLLATVTTADSGSPVNQQTKSLSEGYLGGVALVNQGSDLIAGQGMSQAMGAAKAAGAGGKNFGAFGALSGGWSRYNTGSHVDMSSLSLMAGLSLGHDFRPGRLTLGTFFEYGSGSYDAHNSFSNAAAVHGDGEIYHVGGGILGRMDFIPSGPGHIYTEASFRAGKAHNEYSSSDLRDALGRKADYDSSSAYYGAHAGLGYMWNITDRAALDLYGKYFWTRQEGDSLRLSTGDPVKFEDVDSQRVRLGGRFSYDLNTYFSPYIGAAYEHEFDGKAKATTNGFSIDAPSLKGDTGIGELGFNLKPSQTLPLSFDLGIQGYTGMREGVTGSLQLRFEF